MESRRYVPTGDRVSHKIALWLKSIGHNDDVECSYTAHGSLNWADQVAMRPDYEYNTNQYYINHGFLAEVCTAPTYMQALSWLGRNKKELLAGFIFNPALGIDIEKWAEDVVTQVYLKNA